METPSSSTRRVTRSQTLAAASANNTNPLLPRKTEEGGAKSRQRSDRSALIDITNDSPIVGLAMGNLKTPSSAAISKKKRMGTPGSGEALLRGQVKTLLQKVEEEAEFSIKKRPFFINSLAAPTPTNTPQIDAPFLTPSPLDPNIFLIHPQMVSEMLVEKKKKEGEIESENLITRSLLLDFSEKSSESPSSSVCSSVLTYQGAIVCGSEDDDNASVWSMQVNASSNRDDEEEEECDDVDYYHYEEEEEDDFGDKNDDGMLDELCEGMSKISVGAGGFMGKHIRFVYNSDDDDDDEIEGIEKVMMVSESSSCSPTKSSGGVLRFKGKHIQFPQQ